MIEWIGKRGWYLMNGNIKGDWEGEYTYVGGRGSSVIDYAVVNEKVRDKVVEFKVGDRVDSDHMPMCLKIRTKERRGQEEREAEEEVKVSRIVCRWDERAIQNYKKNTESKEKEKEGEEQEEESTEELWQKLKEWVQNAMIKKEVKIKRHKLGHKDWWDRSCTRNKMEVKGWYSKWKEGSSTRERWQQGRK